ncbi:multi antimicrobial extrusion protein MatE [Lederbergia sp. NSJ-179]|uniref:multi antimicrobial extrusion protein MatE n=1 Tax=Lederbergia sp. NSJ-179 TaxID=2931402 RepID=UPI001FD39238|nr:multi antimicrobial extrusion protein MatE [Lederbergia sp. NSJ-179]MCJ7839778.1 multi antimicrobial extrusion protein MatE [Lederbergia sp. NSJ-179]
MALSSSLTSLTHIIINGTLSRGENATFVIACYAVAFSLFGIIERPIISLRQTSSALVKNPHSFKTITILFLQVTGIIVFISLLISYTRVGDWLFVHFFNASEDMVYTISQTFKVITLVVIFSGIRGIYQGFMINQLETKWITIGVVLRLLAMLFVAYVFIQTDRVTSMVGALIFLIGMIIEMVISVWRGQRLLWKQKNNKEPSVGKKEMQQFYTPLVFFFVIQTLLIPVVYAFLAKTNNIEAGIASFALAYSICQLLLSFFMFTHQIVLQFYDENKEKVIHFIVIISLIPALLLGILCVTKAGPWFMDVIMGADPSLSKMTIMVLTFFLFRALLFPWVDFLNGYLMLKKRTKKMLMGQIANFVTVFLCLIVFVAFFPEWNGIIGAASISIGELTGLGVVLFNVVRVSKEPTSSALKKNSLKVE